MARIRDERFTVRLTGDEKELLREKMRQAGMKNIADFIMVSVCRHHSTVVDTSPILEIKGELSKIGGNVNQIAKVANSTHSIYAEDIKQLQNELNAVRELVEKAFKMCIEGRKTNLGIYENNTDQDQYTS